MVFPPAAFLAAGGRIIDVTKAPYFAKGDGVTDDTAALRAAYTWVLDQIDATGWTVFFPTTNAPSYVIYLPNGTYRVRDTFIYNGPVRVHPSAAVSEDLAWVRIIGESREQTIIRLDDNVPAFAGATPRPVVSFGKMDFNNIPGSNSLRNLTVRVGTGNPNAVGVYFGGANQSDIENVAIIAEGSSGLVGLDNSIGTILGYQRDVLVEGFDYGIRMLPYHFTQPTIEHATVRNQRVAGVQLVDGTAALRKLKSVNAVPAMLLSSGGAHAVLVDSALEGGAAGQPGVKLVAGHFFGRNVTVAGYGQGVVKVAGSATTTVVPGSISEYVSDPPVTFSASIAPTSLALPVEEVPVMAWDSNFAHWVAPNTPGNGAADAASAVRAAMASGSSTVYFPGYEYALDSTVDIPCTVQRVQFLFSTISGTAGTKFRVVGNCPEPLLLQDVTFDNGLGIEHAGRRPLILQRATTQAHLYQNTVTTGGPVTFFGNMIGGVKAADPFVNLKAFIRCANAESPTGEFNLQGSTTSAWFLGFKTEKAPIAFQAHGGAKLEVLGGILNQYSSQSTSTWVNSVAIVNDNSSISIVAATNGPSTTIDGFETLVRDTQGGVTKDFRYDDAVFPKRVGRLHQEIIPLYVSP